MPSDTTTNNNDLCTRQREAICYLLKQMCEYLLDWSFHTPLYIYIYIYIYIYMHSWPMYLYICILGQYFSRYNIHMQCLWNYKVIWIALSRDWNTNVSHYKVTLSAEIRTCWLCPFQRGNVHHKKRGILGPTLNCIWWWASSSGALGSVKLPLHGY